MGVDTLFIGGPMDGRRTMEPENGSPHREVREPDPSLSHLLLVESTLPVFLTTHTYSRLRLTDSFQVMVHSETPLSIEVVTKLLFDYYKADDL